MVYNEHWGAVYSIKYCKKRLPLKWRNFLRKVVSLSTKILQVCSLIRCLKALKNLQQGWFSVIILSQLCWQIESTFSGICYLMHIGYTPIENSGIWQLPKVSCVLNSFMHHYFSDELIFYFGQPIPQFENHNSETLKCGFTRPSLV